MGLKLGLPKRLFLRTTQFFLLVSQVLSVKPVYITENKMGIDLKSGGRRKGHNVRKAPVSKNVYLKLLEKLYRY